MGETSFGGWTIHVQAMLDAAPHGYDQPPARYDTPGMVYDTADGDAVWATIDCQVTRVVAGRGGKLDRVPGMRADVGMLRAQLYDPGRVLDPAAGVWPFVRRPGRGVRLVAVQPGGVVHVLWTGTVESWDHDLLTGEGELVAVDHVARMAAVRVADWRRPAEDSWTRLRAAVATMRDPVLWWAAGGTTQLDACALSGDLWSAVVCTVSESEQSMVYVNRRGWLCRSDLEAFWPDPLTAVDCDDGLAELVYTRLGDGVGNDLIANHVLTERVGVTVDRAMRATGSGSSIAQPWGTRTLTEGALQLRSDTALAVWSRRVLDLRAWPRVDLTGMTVTLSDVLPWCERSVLHVANLDVGQVLDVRLSSRGVPGVWGGVVIGVRHTITPDVWDCELDVAPVWSMTPNLGYDYPLSRYDSGARYDRQAGIDPAGVVALVGAGMRGAGDGV